MPGSKTCSQDISPSGTALWSHPFYLCDCEGLKSLAVSWSSSDNILIQLRQRQHDYLCCFLITCPLLEGMGVKPWQACKIHDVLGILCPYHPCGSFFLDGFWGIMPTPLVLIVPSSERAWQTSHPAKPVDKWLLLWQGVRFSQAKNIT